jgi:hypothetical protein
MNNEETNSKNQNSFRFKHEMDALYHLVKGMDEKQLRLMRAYATHIIDDDVKIDSHMTPPDVFIMPNSMLFH